MSSTDDEAQDDHDKRLPSLVDNGIIQEITMENFMCHDFQTLSVADNMNFVVGHNGSGKSACLAALTLGLGGKSVLTNRGSNLRALIKQDKHYARVVVTIKNQGDTAYRHEDFGDAIIIERNFTTAGTSGFKIKSATGKLISTKRSELDDITDFYGLQVDNPLTILTQDMARQFLSSSLPADKYKFFVRGVQLEQLEQDYNVISEQLDSLEATWDERELYIKQKQSDLKVATENYRAISRLGDLQRKMEQYRMKLVWCQVVEQERKHSGLSSALEELQASISVLHDEAQEAARLYDEADSQKQTAELAITAAKEELQPILDEDSEAKDLRETLKAETSRLQSDQRLAKGNIQKVKEKITKKEQDIALEEGRLAEMNGHGQRQKELEELQAAATSAEATHKQHVSRDPELKKASQIAIDVERQHKAAREPLQTAVDEAESRIQQLRSSNSRAAAYHPQLPNLVKAIQQDKGFQTKPIGPLGNNVSLLRGEWSSILEKFFGASLNTFLVHSKTDQERLMSIMRRVKCNLPVSIIKAGGLTSINEPDSGFDTVLRVLDIDNETAQKYLIINHNIEQVILIKNLAEARKVMFSSRVNNVKACFSFAANDESGSHGERFAYGPSGVNTTFAEGYNGHPRMKVPTRDLIEHANTTLQERRKALHEHDQMVPQLRADVEAAKQAFARHTRDAKNLRLAANEADEKAKDFQAKLENDLPQQGRLEELKKSLVTLNEERQQHEETYSQCIAEVEKIKLKRSEDRKRTDDLPARLAAANEKLHQAELGLRDIERARSNALVLKNEKYALVEEKEAERDNPDDGLQVLINNIKTLIVRFIEKASEYGERVSIDDNETVTSVTKRYHELEGELENQQQRLGGSPEHLAAVYREAKEKYEFVKQQYEDDKQLERILLQALHSRRDRWKLFRQHITARARLNFSYLLSSRAFRGELKIDHLSRTLDVVVQPDETKDGKGKRAAKTLSGGEKSFAQICLILAIWQTAGVPVRCLDEFDVYMDSINRDLALKLLIDAARSSPGRQFIFITPQSMGSLADGPDIKVHKMRDPERSGVQQRLPFVAAA